MIKNKALACSIVLVAVLLTKLYSSSNVDNVPKGTNPVAWEFDKQQKTTATVDSAERDPYWSDVTFAEEEVPLDDPAVKTKLNTYLKRFSYKKIQSYKMHRKANEYLPRIAKILASYGIPEDFKYIPVVESDLDPRTSSHKGAGGYWQFIPATARLYGLRVDGDVDDRMDLTKSTHAAAKYLKALHREFGDWTLVAAAYNVGGGSLKRSIRRQGTESYYDLNLNKETGSYVYKIISVKSVIEHPDRFGYRRLAKANTDVQEDVAMM